MKIACGTDIIEIERVKKSIERTGKAFVNKIYTQKEIEYCESKKSVKYQHYAARFAAKEACFKALNSVAKYKNGVMWQDIEVINNEKGKPTLNLRNIDLKRIISIDISISHCKEYAVANVVMLYEGEKNEII